LAVLAVEHPGFLAFNESEQQYPACKDEDGGNYKVNSEHFGPPLQQQLTR
jgi:hypothetical protein